LADFKYPESFVELKLQTLLEHLFTAENILPHFLCKKKKQKRKLLAMDILKKYQWVLSNTKQPIIMLFHPFPSSKNIYFSLKQLCRWSGNCSF